MRVALIFPPSPFLIDEKVNPPLGMGYLAAFLKSKGIDTSFYHITSGTEIPEISADVIGIGGTTPQYPEALRVMRKLRNSNPNSLFVIGGPHASAHPEHCLREGFDTVVVGEGELALFKVVTEQLKGIVYGEEIDIDELPYPDYDAMNISSYDFPVLSYGKTGYSDHVNFFAIFTSRGCPFDCNFCASNVIWKKFRSHSIEYIKQHVLHIKEKYGVRAIMIMDDLFTLNKRRTREIGNFLKEHEIAYRCLSRSNALDEETVSILVNTGCVEVGVGIESNNQLMLDVMNKKTTVQQNRDAIINCKRAGLSIKVFLIIGSPGESRKTLDETFQVLEELQPDDVDANILVLYPGTEFHDNIQKYDVTQVSTEDDKQIFKGQHLGICNSTVATSKLTAQELEEYKQKIFAKFSKMRIR